MDATEETPAGVAKEGYYGIPMLKRPTWGWEIACYYYLEGISAGSFVLASLANVSRRDRLGPLVHAGYYTSFVSFLPCPPLLIADLGDPSRFHHMLRVFKPTSPMNLGAWSMAVYSLPLMVLAGTHAADELSPAIKWLKVLRRLLPSRLLHAFGIPPAALMLTHTGVSLSVRSMKALGKMVPSRFLGALGLAPALTMLSYPGVLLSTTSTPMWSKSRFLGALLACGSFNDAVAATSLVLALRGRHNSESLRLLGRIERVARIAEAILLGTYLVTARKAVKPLLKGRHGWLFWAGAVGAGLVLPTIMKAKASRRRPSLGSIMLRSALSLAGGFALKWAITQAGRESALDVEISREVTKPGKNAPGWNQNSK